MFLLKRITNFQKHKYFYIVKEQVYVITSSTIEIYDKSLNFINLIDIKDEIISTIKNGFYILTPNYFLDFFKDIKIQFKHKFIKMMKFKDLILFVGTNKFAFYKYNNDILSIDWEFKKSFDDLLVSENIIYLLYKNNITCYEYHRKLLIRKKIAPKLHFHISTPKKTPFSKFIDKKISLIYIDNDNLLVVDRFERFYQYNSYTILIYNNKSAYFDHKTLSFHDNVYPLQYCDKDCTYVIVNDQISRYPDFKKYKYIKQARLKNIKNINHNFIFKNNNEDIECKNNIYESINYFVKLKGIKKGFETDKYVIVILDTKIFKYVKIEDKLKYKECIEIDFVIFVNKNFILYQFKKIYYIFSVEDNFTYKYKGPDGFKYYKDYILDIRKNKDKIFIIKSNIVKIYKINTSKYKKVIDIEKKFEISIYYNKLLKQHQLYKNLKLENEYYFAFDDLYIYVYDNVFIKIYKIDNLKKHVININYKLAINSKALGQKIIYYKELIFVNSTIGIFIFNKGGFVKRDPISRNIISFSIINKKIFCNDSSNYLIVLSFDFVILGMIYIGELIKSYKVKDSGNVILISENENEIRIKEIDGVHRDVKEYFNSFIKINFTTTF